MGGGPAKIPQRQFWKYYYSASDQSVTKLDQSRTPVLEKKPDDPIGKGLQEETVTSSPLMDHATNSTVLGDQSPASEYGDMQETLGPSNPGTPTNTALGAATPTANLKANLSPQRRLNWLNDPVSSPSRTSLRSLSQLPYDSATEISSAPRPKPSQSSTIFSPLPPLREPGFRPPPVLSSSASQYNQSPNQLLITGPKSCSSSPSLDPKNKSHVRGSSVSTDGDDTTAESTGQSGKSMAIPSSTGVTPSKSSSKLEAAISQLLRSPLAPLSSPRPSPLGTPVRKVLVSMREYLEELGHLTTLGQRDNWLPVTASRAGNAYYSAFHSLNACLGFHALFLPAAFAYLGWSWGIISLLVAFVWQLYTNWLLITMHEIVPDKRVSRYVELAQLAFGERTGFHIALPVVLNLAAGAGLGLVVIGGTALKLFIVALCHECKLPLSTIEWFLVFALSCAVLVHLPSLNSIAGVSLVGAIMAVSYCTLVWIISVSRRAQHVSYEIARIGEPTAASVIFSTLNALGIVAFAFQGHNLTLEIQATMPSTDIKPARTPMWRGTKAASAIIALCYFPVSICGYWAFGHKISKSGDILTALSSSKKEALRHHGSFEMLLGLTFLLVVLHSLSSFQLYSIQVFDMMEKLYTIKTGRKVSALERFSLRSFYVFFLFFFAIAFPFVASFGGLIGGLNIIPATFVLPCFMWLAIAKPKQRSFHWYLNWGLGIAGMAISIAVSAGGIWSIVQSGIHVRFFKPTG